MNISLLEEGVTYKNYPTLCKALEMPRRAGKSKMLQMEDLDLVCKVVKKGHSLTITEVYDNPQEILDGKTRKRLYGNLMELMISDYLLEVDVTPVVITRGVLLEEIEAVNKLYRYGDRNKSSIAKFTEVDSSAVHDFYDTSKSMFKNAVESALENLRKETFLMYDRVTMVCDRGGHHRIAEQAEVDYILSAEAKALEILDVKSIGGIYATALWGEFKNLVSRELNEKGNISYYYKSYKIYVNQEYIDKLHIRKLDDISKELDYDNTRNELNVFIADRLLVNAERRKDRTDNTKVFGELRTDKERARESPVYIEDNKKLIELLIHSDVPVERYQKQMSKSE